MPHEPRGKVEMVSHLCYVWDLGFVLSAVWWCTSINLFESVLYAAVFSFHAT